MAIMNYNEWFHQYHRYLEGYRNGVASYNDTKWNNINERYKNLVDISSTLLDEQPYGVVGNYVGFQQLNQLIQESGYTYDDVDTSFMEMYRMNLQNAMGNMLVNTHAVIAHYNQSDKKNVYHDPYGHYYIIDVPFMQLHFGERDEFIRQKLHEFYETENQYYMPSDKFLSDEISSILGFTLICCVNGVMTDDWYVGIDEKGFRIKIGWKYSANADFIVYKLDQSKVFDFNDVAYENVVAEMEIPYENLGIQNPSFENKHCIIQITDPSYIKDVNVVPNFGYFTSTGLQISNMQNKTLRDLKNWGSENHKLKLRVYVIKYLYEIEGIFPAINYLEMIGTHNVYNERYQHITDDEGKYVHARETNIGSYADNICTPPISPEYDYSTTENHSVLYDCYNSIPILRNSIDEMSTIIGYTVPKTLEELRKKYSSNSDEYYYDKIIAPSKVLYEKMLPVYQLYLKCAIITSLIQKDYVEKFGEIIEQLRLLQAASPNYTSIQNSLQSSILYDEEYKPVIEMIIASLDVPPFSTIGQITYPDYFPETYRSHFWLRPISEQCLITLKYDPSDDMKCWIFDIPNIKHFKGIENVFYIDENLTGEEIYKFMFLYTDTEDPAQTVTNPLTFDQMIDFDLFSNELRKHIGYVKYWHTCNRLAKLSQILYQSFDDDTVVSILSRVLKQKTTDDVFIEYPSEINYEISNISSDNVGDYTEYSQRAPFALNFMFYTLRSLFDQPDRLQSYFLDVLTRKTFHPRYQDLELYDIYENKTPNPGAYSDWLNFSIISFSPFGVYAPSALISQLPDENEIKTFTGVNFPIDISNHSLRYIRPMINDGVRYPWVFNLYQTRIPYTMYTPNSIASNNPYYYMEFNNIESYISYPELKRNTFYDDAQIAKMISVFLAEIYPGYSEIVTDYKNIWNKTSLLQSMMKTVERHGQIINDYIRSRGNDITYRNPDTQTYVDNYFPEETLSANELYDYLSSLDARVTSLRIAGGQGSIFELTSTILMMLQKVHENTGFDRYAIQRVRNLYIHLKKINNQMGYYEYKEWLDHVDEHTLMELGSYFSDNPEIIISRNEIARYCRKLNTCIISIKQIIPMYEELLESFVEFFNNMVSDLSNYCNDIVQNYIFDFYTMNPITIPTTTVNSKPAFAEIHIDADDPHVDFGLTDDYKTNNNVFELLFSVNFDTNGSQYIIYHAIPTCVYAFKSNTPMTVSLYIYDQDCNEIAMLPDIELTFSKVGTSSDIKNDTYRYSNGYQLPLEVQNVHESFDVNGFDHVVNTRHAEMHYELLCGNHFVPLDHTSEYCVQSKLQLQGPIDKLYLSCEKINALYTTDQANRVAKSMFFEPIMVLHIQPVDGVITSIGGKYYEGQRIYAITNDGLNLIPLIITAVDHSQAQGMIEARVDLYRAKWFETTDTSVMETYLTEDIACTILDDNIRNFMDEFTDYDGPLYPLPDVTSTINENHEIAPQFLTLPGDPYFVETNPDYVYARLVDMFPSDIHDDPEDPYHRFIYLGSGDICYNTSDEIKENYISFDMINHNFNPFTLPELYPILRDEPDDLPILKKEKAIFDGNSYELLQIAIKMEVSSERKELQQAVINAKTPTERTIAMIKLARYEDQIAWYITEAQRLEVLRRDLEVPTTWYNVRAYDDALVYINNGRAKTFRSFNPRIHDISYNENLEIRLYDWEHRVWIDPSEYTIEKTVTDGIQIDPVNEYKTDDVLTSIKIIFNPLVSYDSKRILIYLVYSSKDQFDIPLNDMTCTVRFRPVLSLKSTRNDDDVDAFYRNVRIRKHYDSNETFTTNYMVHGKPELEPLPDEFVDMDGFIFHRPSRSGKYTNGSSIRFGDMTVKIDDQIHYVDEFDVYVPNPMSNTTMDQVTITNTYENMIVRTPDGFEPNREVILIPISNQNDIKFNGVVSNVMFKGITDEFTITITGCTTLFEETQTILCTVLPNERHEISGGVVRVTVVKGSETEPAIKNWIHLTSDSYDIMHRLIPDTVALVPKEVSMSDNVVVILSNHYIKDFDDDVRVDNLTFNSPFCYYYDKQYHVRYPVADVRKNKINERLTIDRSMNQNVDIIRSNYIGITRYVSQHIPKDGVIDLTGYIPTPLSRDRYEFWVNGRYVNDTRHLLILSPTTIQLRNLVSLKNLEVIELVDDIKDTILTPSGPIYIDINGTTYSSYLEMVKNRANIMDTSIQYYFNQNTHGGIDTYVPEPKQNPNNKDYEIDILSYLTFNDTITSYDELYNIPTINGVDVYHLTSATLGFMELPNQVILDAFDQVWKREALDGIVPFGHKASYYDTNIKEQYLHVKKNPDGGFDIYTSGLDDHTFTLYISDIEDGRIDSSHTKKIMPMLHPGVKIHIEDAYENMWLHSTNPVADPIQIK